MFTFLKNLFVSAVPNSPIPISSAPAGRAVPQGGGGVARQGAAGMTTVMDDQGIVKRLAGKLAHGGEGVVHRLAERSDILVKIYHPEVLADALRKQRLERKIREMSNNEALRNHPRAAWPLVCLKNPTGEWCGYAMRVKEGVSLRELFGNPFNLARLAPVWHRQHLVRLCVDFLDTIESFGAEKTLPVDFNPSNFLIDIQDICMSFIDCDGFQFKGVAGIHLSEAVLPEMAGPEVLRRKSWHEAPVAEHSLRFSLAMTLFYILTIGNSPYRHRNGNDPVRNLMDGSCGLGTGAECQLPKGSFYTIWSHLIFDLKALFIRCFREGHGNSSVRPTIAEWRVALLKYNQCLKAGHSDASLIPDRPKSSGFRGSP